MQQVVENCVKLVKNNDQTSFAYLVELISHGIELTSPRRNRAGAYVKLSPQRGYQTIFYCGRRLGREAISGSDGQCGPTNGPQCPDCKASQDSLSVVEQKTTGVALQDAWKGLSTNNNDAVLAAMPLLTKALAGQLGMKLQEADTTIVALDRWRHAMRWLMAGDATLLKDQKMAGLVNDMVMSVSRAPGCMSFDPHTPLTKVSRGLRGIIALSSLDIHGITDVATQIGAYDASEAATAVRMLKKHLTTSSTLSEEGEEEEEETAGGTIQQQCGHGDVTTQDLFNMFDSDNSGSIEFAEFLKLSKYMQLHLSEHKAQKVFTQADRKGNDRIDFDEFEYALRILRQYASENAYVLLGVSRGTLVKLFLGSVSVLLLLFLFIFVGIAAFTNGTTFGAIVNSMMPVAAGNAADGGKDEEGEEESEEHVDKVVGNVLQMMSPEA